MDFQPPPRRTSTPSAPAASTSSDQPAAGGWKAKMKAKGAVWGKIAIEKSVAISDNVGGKVNNIAEKQFGTEHFWPVTGDFGREMDKCARILRTFTVEGIINEEPIVSSASGTSTPATEQVDDKGKSKSKKSSRKVLRKIPPQVVANAKGLVIFTSMRTGIAPFGGAGGAGVVVAKLPDGNWSAPASISPNNLSAGFLLGIDVYDAVLIINSQKALDSFKTHKATLGAELGVAAGPYGAGASVEAGMETAAIFSYVKSKGMYAGVEVVGQVFVERFDENAAMYVWPGVKAGDILAGKVKVPREAAALHQALKDAETGRAQAADPLKPDGAEVIQNQDGEMIIPDAGSIVLEDGEVLHLPPTPSMMTGSEAGVGSSQPIPVIRTSQSSSSSPAPTPPRLPTRPVLAQQKSSVSDYADALDEPAGSSTSDPFGNPAHSSAQAVTADHPPAYNEETPDYAAPYTAAADAYPDEKAELKRQDEAEASRIHVRPISPSRADDANLMNESERREWAQAEEMIQQEKEEMERLQIQNQGRAHAVDATGSHAEVEMVRKAGELQL